MPVGKFRRLFLYAYFIKPASVLKTGYFILRIGVG
jgi:hypothetical protein